MGHIEVAHVSHVLPDGRVLLDDVSFRVGDGMVAALVGPNGAGKTTLMRLAAGDLAPQSGSVSSSGGIGVMRQFIGGIRDDSTVRDLLLSVSAPRVRQAAAQLDAAELVMMERDDERAQLRYAAALAEWGDAGGYQAEVHWDSCCTAALGVPYDGCRWREVRTLSGGEQKRLVLESLLRDRTEVLLLDEPDNYLDVPGKLWLEEQLAATAKTVLLVSHDRELLANCAERIITVEDRNVWVHGGGFATYAQARRDRNERLDELRRRWDEEHDKLEAAGADVPAEGVVQLGHGLPAAGRGDPAAQVRGGRAARAGAAGAERADAAARRPHRQAGRDLREPRAHRADARL